MRTSSPKYEVADIFRQYGEEYRSQIGLTAKQKKVMLNIEHCRTSAYGYHVDQCDHCGNTEEDFNSCRDRHCPKCQGISRNKWVKARLLDLLPVPHYHTVFTLPHFLHPLIRYNRRLIYNLLFESASNTLLTFGKDPRWLGGEIGFYGVLHTWGQTLWQHPHLHFIVPGGALTDDGRWLSPRYKRKFLFPTAALSKVFRGKFIEGLKKAHHNKTLIIPPDLSDLEDERAFELWIDTLVGRKWVVYCKPPFGDAEDVVRYIGRYTHRVAISNHRIISIGDGQVRFKYKDYKSSSITWKDMSLKSHDFIERFLFHILPAGFHKIRHFGFLANGRSKAKIKQIRKILDENCRDVGQDHDQFSRKCPRCEIGFFRPIMIINTFGRLLSSAESLIINKGYAFDTS